MRELNLLRNMRLVVALGGIALNAYLSVLQEQGKISSRAQFPFAHGRLFRTHSEGPNVLCSYHPSQQNTSTKRLNREMLRDLFLEARRLLDSTEGCPARLPGAGAHSAGPGNQIARAGWDNWPDPRKEPWRDMPVLKLEYNDRPFRIIVAALR